MNVREMSVGQLVGHAIDDPDAKREQTIDAVLELARRLTLARVIVRQSVRELGHRGCLDDLKQGPWWGPLCDLAGMPEEALG